MNSRKLQTLTTPDRRQSKTLLTIDERGSKIAARNSDFDSHLSPLFFYKWFKKNIFFLNNRFLDSRHPLVGNYAWILPGAGFLATSPFSSWRGTISENTFYVIRSKIDPVTKQLLLYLSSDKQKQSQSPQCVNLKPLKIKLGWNDNWNRISLDANEIYKYRNVGGTLDTHMSMNDPGPKLQCFFKD